jgi:hypothetical protein
LPLDFLLVLGPFSSLSKSKESRPRDSDEFNSNIPSPRLPKFLLPISSLFGRSEAELLFGFLAKDCFLAKLDSSFFSNLFPSERSFEENLSDFDPNEDFLPKEELDPNEGSFLAPKSSLLGRSEVVSSSLLVKNCFLVKAVYFLSAYLSGL